MSKLYVLLVAALVAVAAHAADDPEPATPRPEAVLGAAAVPASERLEKELQSLDWKQFRSVIEAIPKLKADVDAYGPLGWQYVQTHYRTYRWRKSIDKLDADQKVQLAALIEKTRRSEGHIN